MTDAAPPPRDGRSLRWRIGAFLFGGLLAGAAVGLCLHPEILSYVVAGGLAIVSLLMIASAILAKGRS